MTKEDLRAYEDLRRERDHLAHLIEELESVLYGPKVPTLDGMPRGGSFDNSHVVDKMGDKHAKLQKLYEEKVAELDRRIAEIEAAIEPLEPNERKLIRLHYIEGLTWEDVAVEMSYSWRHVHRIHGRALQKLQTWVPSGATSATPATASSSQQRLLRKCSVNIGKRTS